MSKMTPQSKAKQAAIALIRATREAGWLKAKFEIKPDGCLIVDAEMVDRESLDDFYSSELRMTK